MDEPLPARDGGLHDLCGRGLVGRSRELLGHARPVARDAANLDGVDLFELGANERPSSQSCNIARGDIHQDGLKAVVTHLHLVAGDRCGIPDHPRDGCAQHLLVGDNWVQQSRLEHSLGTSETARDLELPLEVVSHARSSTERLGRGRAISCLGIHSFAIAVGKGKRSSLGQLSSLGGEHTHTVIRVVQLRKSALFGLL
jgi:hypothetical protein